MKQHELYEEVSQEIDAAIQEGKPVNANWLTHFIVQRHSGIKGKDTEWYQLCAYEHVRDTVRQSIGRYRPEVETRRDVLLPGFEYLQNAYLVEREKEQVVVPINQLTNKEITSKITEYEKMADGCVKHADELRRYMRERGRNQSA